MMSKVLQKICNNCNHKRCFIDDVMRKPQKAFSREEQAELTAKRVELARVKAKCEKDFI